jgi:hypothetical protein
VPPYLLAVAEDLVGEAGKLETAIIAAVSAAPSRAQLSPGQVCGFPWPHPDQGLIHRPTNGGHCGGDGSVLRLRAAVARTNWRGPAA